MSGIRIQPAAAAEQIWRLLHLAGERGMTVSDVMNVSDVSGVYARRLMRIWAEAGYARRVDPTEQTRTASARFFIAPDAPKEPPILSVDGEVHPRAGYMSPAEFAAIRRQLGETLIGMGRRLGRTGAPSTLNREMRRYETGERPIDERTTAALRALITPPA